MYKRILISIFLLVAFFVMSQGAMAEDAKCTGDSTTCYGLETSVPSALKSNTDVPITIGKIVGAGLAFIGILFFILMIYGGILWMTAQGNEQQTTKAKGLIIAAVIGLIIVLSAYAITAYIGGAITDT